MIQILIALAFVLSAVVSKAESGEVEPGKCYPAHVFKFQIIHKEDKNNYGMVGLNTPPHWPKINALHTKTEIESTGVPPFKIKMLKDVDVKVNGFKRKARVWEECSKNE